MPGDEHHHHHHESEHHHNEDDHHHHHHHEDHKDLGPRAMLHNDKEREARAKELEREGGDSLQRTIGLLEDSSRVADRTLTAMDSNTEKMQKILQENRRRKD